MNAPTEPHAHAAFCAGERMYDAYMERRDPRGVFERARNVEFMVHDLLVYAHFMRDCRLLPEEISHGALEDARETISAAERANRYGEDTADPVDWDAERKSAEVG